MPLLSDPVRFRNGVQARNRAWLAPMTNLQSNADGTLSDDEFDWLVSRADGGFGVIETCAAYVSDDGKGWPGELGVSHDAQLPGLTRLAAALRATGSLGIVQIFHGGVRAPTNVTGMQPWSASAWHEDGSALEVPRPATTDDIETAIDKFREAAVRSHRAGFSGVEIHGAHGYLLTQFLSTVQNTRADRWGGSLENRARLMREVTRAVRGAVPSSFLVGVRISPEDFGNTKGVDLDENIELARWLADDGIDFLHVSLWDFTRTSTKRPGTRVLPLFRQALPRDLIMIAAGKVWSKNDVDSVLADGADCVAVGRAGIVNPDWPIRIATGQPITPAPVTAQQLRERGLSERFIEYLRATKRVIADD